MTDSGMPIGRHLEAIRKARGLTFKSLDYSSGPRIEKGTNVSMALITRYMKVMDISPVFSIKFRGSYVPKTDNPFLEVIRYAMVAKKIKVAQLANLADLSYDKFFRIHGGYRPMRVKDCERLFKLLGITTKFV